MMITSSICARCLDITMIDDLLSLHSVSTVIKVNSYAVTNIMDTAADIK